MSTVLRHHFPFFFLYTVAEMAFHCIRTYFKICRVIIISFKQVSPWTLLTTYFFDLPVCCSYLHHCSLYSIVFYIPSINPKPPSRPHALY